METAQLVPNDFNAFSDDVYIPQATPTDETVVVTLATPAAETVETVVTTETVNTETKSDVFDPNVFVKEKFGYETVEEAETSFKSLKEKAEKPFEFANEKSKRLFDAIKEDKIDDITSILNEQKKISRLITGDVDANLAVEIIKTDLQSKYKQLSAEEVDLMFYDKYDFPKKPVEDIADTTDEYAQRLSEWESKVDLLQKRMIIDAKVVRPELEKLNEQIVLPDVYNSKATEEQNRISQEKIKNEEEIFKQSRIEYEKALDSQYNSFEGFSVSAKDEEVELPITFAISQEEKLALKEELSDFDGVGFLDNRWFSKEGKPNVVQAMSDKYVLENLQKILQKVANESASQMKLHLLKKGANITIGAQTTPLSQGELSKQQVDESMAEWAFSS